MQIEMIVAYDLNRAIGRGGQIPWKISADLKRFKELTTGHALALGRKTFDSMGKRCLPGRFSVVFSNTLPQTPDETQEVRTGLGEGGVFWKVTPFLATPEYLRKIAEGEAEAAGRSKLFVIGGGAMYKAFAPFASKIHVTEVHQRTDGADAFFPMLDLSDWEKTEEPLVLETDTTPAYQYITFTKKE